MGEVSIRPPAADGLDCGTGALRRPSRNEENETVKRNAVILAGAVTLALTFYFATMVWAQQRAGGQPPYPGTAAPAAPATQQPAQLHTKIALVNLQQVIKSYLKYQNFEKEFQEQYKRTAQQIEAKNNQMVQYQNLLKSNPSAPQNQRDEFELKMKALQREMQDLDEAAKKHLSKMRDDQSVQIYREVEEAVKRFAVANGIELVLHYNDAPDAEVYQPVHVQRKLGVAAGMPIYKAPGMDITNSIAMMLNQRYQASAPATAPAPATAQPVTPATHRPQ
jgi:Skp family chaperone for outer membrane proteins